MIIWYMSHETLHHSAVRHVRRVLAMLQAQMQRQPHVVFAPRRLRFLPEDLGMDGAVAPFLQGTSPAKFLVFHGIFVGFTY